MPQRGGGYVDQSGTTVAPLIGYMTSNTASKTWRQRRELFREMAADARHAGVSLIIFNWDGVDFDNKQLHGWVPHKRTWREAVRPLPDVIYEVTAHRDPEQRLACREVCRRLADECGIPFVSRVSSYSKWRVYQVLQAADGTRDLQPATVPFGDFKALLRMVRRHGTIYTKDRWGSRGMSVMRIRPGADGWRLEGRCRGTPVNEFFPTLMGLYQHLKTLDLEDWILQQGIEGTPVEGWTFDLRVVVQKDGRGEWDIALSFLRWATTSHVANNLSQGARQIDPADFSLHFGDQVHGLPTFQADAHAASVKVAKVLGDHFGTLGEVGVDVGLDREGRVWVFEVNRKPVRKAGFSMHRRIFAYARLLASQHTAA